MSLFSRNDTQELGCRMLSAEISPPPLLPFLYFHFVKSRFLYFCFLFTHIFLPICKFSWFFKYQTLFSDQDRCPIWVKCYIPAIGYSRQTICKEKWACCGATKIPFFLWGFLRAHCTLCLSLGTFCPLAQLFLPRTILMVCRLFCKSRKLSPKAGQ